MIIGSGGRIAGSSSGIFPSAVVLQKKYDLAQETAASTGKYLLIVLTVISTQSLKRLKRILPAENNQNNTPGSSI